MECAVDGTWLVWQEHIDPNNHQLPDEGIVDDPYRLWAQREGDSPRLLHEGYMADSAPYVARGYVVWVNGDFLREVTSLADPAVTRVLRGDAGSPVATSDGDTLVLITTTAKSDVAQVFELSPS